LHLGYRRGKSAGRWVVRTYIGGQSYRVETLGTADDKADADGVASLSFSQAQATARKLFSAAARTQAGLPAAQGGPYTVKMAAEDYVVWLEHEGRSESTISGTRGTFDAHIIPKLGDTRVDRLTTPQIKAWLSALAKTAPRLRVKDGKKQRYRLVDMNDDEVRRQRRSSANRILGFLKAALNLAWRSDRALSDKAWRAVGPFKSADASRARYLPLEECRRLVGACEEDFGELVQGGLYTGARYGELGRLVPSDFNPDVGTIAIRKSKNRQAAARRVDGRRPRVLRRSGQARE
jgi:integrase